MGADSSRCGLALTGEEALSEVASSSGTFAVPPRSPFKESVSPRAPLLATCSSRVDVASVARCVGGGLEAGGVLTSIRSDAGCSASASTEDVAAEPACGAGEAGSASRRGMGDDGDGEAPMGAIPEIAGAPTGGAARDGGGGGRLERAKGSEGSVSDDVSREESVGRGERSDVDELCGEDNNGFNGAGATGMLAGGGNVEASRAVGMADNRLVEASGGGAVKLPLVEREREERLVEGSEPNPVGAGGKEERLGGGGREPSMERLEGGGSELSDESPWGGTLAESDGGGGREPNEESGAGSGRRGDSSKDDRNGCPSFVLRELSGEEKVERVTGAMLAGVGGAFAVLSGDSEGVAAPRCAFNPSMLLEEEAKLVTMGAGAKLGGIVSWPAEIGTTFAGEDWSCETASSTLACPAP
jgi:hypothetical protein